MSKIIIIGEAGINFDGNISKAYDLIDAIHEAGADLVKFQLYSVDVLFPNKQIIINGKDYYDMVKKCELTFEQTHALFDYGKNTGIEVFFSVFDTERVKWCQSIGVQRYKIGSKSIDDKELSDVLRNTEKPLIVSFPFGEITPNRAILWSTAQWLYCVPKYPTSGSDALQAANFFNPKRFDGLSEHSSRIIAACRAVKMGARIIEKHITLSRNLGLGPDHSSSIEPEELKKLVLKCKNGGKSQWKTTGNIKQ